jgi:hypothetical protein
MKGTSIKTIHHFKSLNLFIEINMFSRSHKTHDNA